jgi:hypothetical protein
LHRANTTTSATVCLQAGSRIYETAFVSRKTSSGIGSLPVKDESGGQRATYLTPTSQSALSRFISTDLEKRITGDSNLDPHFPEPRSIRGDVKKQTFPGTGKGVVIQPTFDFRRCDSAIPQVHRGVRRRLRFAEATSGVVVQCQPSFYLRLVAYRFFWLSEGA